jgi:hypothetical protein
MLSEAVARISQRQLWFATTFAKGAVSVQPERPLLAQSGRWPNDRFWPKADIPGAACPVNLATRTEFAPPLGVLK